MSKLPALRLLMSLRTMFRGRAPARITKIILLRVGVNDFADGSTLASSAHRNNNNNNNTDKQPFWDRPGVLEGKAQVEASLVSAYHRASFSAALLLPVNTAEIGCLHYPSPRAD